MNISALVNHTLGAKKGEKKNDTQSLPKFTCLNKAAGGVLEFQGCHKTNGRANSYFWVGKGNTQRHKRTT